MRAIDIGNLNTGEIMHLAGNEGNGLLAAGFSRTRETDPMHPCAAAAHAQRAVLAGEDGGIQVEGILVGIGERGDGQPCAGRARNNRGYAKEGVIRVGVLPAGSARCVKRKRAHAAHGLVHAGRREAGNGLDVCFGADGAIGVGSQGVDLDFFQKPVTGSGVIGQRCGAKEDEQAQYEDAQNGFHDGFSFPCGRQSPAHIP